MRDCTLTFIERCDQFDGPLKDKVYKAFYKNIIVWWLGGKPQALLLGTSSELFAGTHACYTFST